MFKSNFFLLIALLVFASCEDNIERFSNFKEKDKTEQTDEVTGNTIKIDKELVTRQELVDFLNFHIDNSNITVISYGGPGSDFGLKKVSNDETIVHTGDALGMYWNSALSDITVKNDSNGEDSIRKTQKELAEWFCSDRCTNCLLPTRQQLINSWDDLTGLTGAWEWTADSKDDSTTTQGCNADVGIAVCPDCNTAFEYFCINKGSSGPAFRCVEN